MKTLYRRLGLAPVIAILIALFTVAAPAGAQQTTLMVEGLKFVDHLTAGMIEQDAFIEKQARSGQVFRPTKEEREKYLFSPVSAIAEPAHHAPFDPKANGPYAKGRSLGFTLAQWLNGTGTASYTCKAGKGLIEASFKNLVPNGVYTMWNFFVAKAHMGCADCPFATIDFPVGAADGSTSKFVANAIGDAEFEAEFSPCLRLGDERLASALAIAYHSDGKTHGPNPGSFGTTSHVQLFTVLPDAGAEKIAAK